MTTSKSSPYEPLDATKPSFRLLRLLRYERTELECELLPLSLSHEIHMRYEALCYTWGSEELVECIVLNGKQFWITDNLYSALRYLRLSDRDRYLWIDAICINQTDKVEQGRQVQQMSLIFKSAASVLFWLGKATIEISSLMDSLGQLQKAAPHDSYRWRLNDPRWKTLWTNILSAGTISANALSSVHYRGLQQLLERPWFSRVWILQEVANAREASVCTSKKAISAHIFALAPQLLGQPLPQHCQSILEIMPGPSRLTSWWIQERNLYILLQKFQAKKATDERDMIYALLGMSSDPQEAQKIVINYSKPVHEVIHEAIEYLIQSTAITVQEVLDLLTSFTSFNTTYFVPAARGRHVTKGFLSRLDIEKNRDAIQGDYGKVNSVQMRRDPALFLLEENTSNDPQVPKSCYAQVVELQLPTNTNELVSCKAYVDGLRVVAWRGAEQNVKILVIEDPQTAILNTAIQGYDQIVKQLQQRMFSGEKQEQFQGSALQQAIKLRYWQAFSVMVEQGADVNAQCQELGHILQAVSFEGNEQIVQLLLDKGADVNAQGGRYGNALQAALYKGYKQIIQLLQKQGAINTPM